LDIKQILKIIYLYENETKNFTEISKKAEVSYPTVKKYVKFYEEDVEKIFQKKHKKKYSGIFTNKNVLNFLNDVLKKLPNIIIKNLKIIFESQFGINISNSMLYYIVVKLLKLKKKNLTFVEIQRQRLDIIMENKYYFYYYIPKLQLFIDKLVFIDETQFNSFNLYPTKGWGEVGEKIYSFCERIGHESFTLCGAISINKFEHYVLKDTQREGTFKSQDFKEFLIELNDKTPIDRIFIMDNWNGHKSNDMKGLFSFFRLTGRIFLFLPRYSPEYNAIELIWNIIKKKLKNVQEKKDLKNKILIEINEINCFKNCIEKVLEN